MYYECHVTFEAPKDPENRKLAEEILGRNGGWKFSCIDGDPILGLGVKCYGTRHYKHDHDIQEMRDDLSQIGSALLQSGRFDVLRTKIEMVIFDDKGWQT